MKNLGNLSIVELPVHIYEALKTEGLQATLSGGACAEIYSNGKYVTGDLDFVVNYFWPENDKTIQRVMASIGFERKGRIFTNKAVAYSVESPPGPLSIGEEYQIKPTEVRFETGNLSLLSPTDSVKDRLTGYLYGNDAQCLEQAVMICEMNEVGTEEIRRWAENEGRPDEFKEFERRVSGRKKVK